MNRAQQALRSAINGCLKKGFTQEEVAAGAGVAQSTISKWSRGLGLPTRPDPQYTIQLRELLATEPAWKQIEPVTAHKRKPAHEPA